MSEHYKFVQNKDCEYFPCHQTSDPEHFNCLFCFCPLYMLKQECGGNFKYTHDAKDCSDCMVPHGRNGYEHVMSKMKTVIRIGSER